MNKNNALLPILAGVGAYLVFSNKSKAAPAPEPDPDPECGEGFELDPVTGECVEIEEPPPPPPPPEPECGEGFVLDPVTGECTPIQPPPPQCEEGFVYDALQGVCVPTQEEVPPPPSGILEKGSSGPKVLKLQRKLCAFFRTLGPVDPGQFGSISWGDFDDGIYGNGTQAAVSDFQAFANITIDGKAGPITQDTLNQQLASVGISPVEAGNTSCLATSES